MVVTNDRVTFASLWYCADGKIRVKAGSVDYLALDFNSETEAVEYLRNNEMQVTCIVKFSSKTETI